MQQVLEQQGIQATSIQQVDELLSSDAYLMAAGFIKGATINVVPVRTLLGGSADWSTKGAHKRDLSYTFQYNENQSLQGSYRRHRTHSGLYSAPEPFGQRFDVLLDPGVEDIPEARRNLARLASLPIATSSNTCLISSFRNGAGP